MNLFLRAGAALLVLAGSTAASAATYVFHLTGAADAQFQLDSNPTIDPFLVFNDAFRINDVAISYNGAAPIGGHQMAFFVEEWGGGLEFFPPFGGFPTAGSYSPGGIQLFTGDKSAPQFKLGTFALTDYWEPQHTYTLTITALEAPASPVPEPASWAMMIGGFGLIGGAMRRRRSVSLSFA